MTGSHDHGPDLEHDHDHDAQRGPGHEVVDEDELDHDHDHQHEHEPGRAHGHPHAGAGRLARFVSALVGHSHDPGDALDEAMTSDARGIRALKVSLVALLMTALLQSVVVLVSGSVALLADTIHNFSDALTSIPLWVAFVVGSRAATRRYTFGYRRAEDLAGLFILVVILASAVLVGWESLERLLHPQAITNIPAVIAAGLIGFLGNEAVALYRIRVGRRIGSAALVADGYHARTDGLTSLAVVVGAIGVAAGYPLADPLMGLLITAHDRRRPAAGLGAGPGAPHGRRRAGAGRPVGGGGPRRARRGGPGPGAAALGRARPGGLTDHHRGP